MEDSVKATQTASAAQNRPTPLVIYGLDMQEQLLAKLYLSVNELEERLNGVLRSPEPTDSENENEKYLSVPLVERLGNHNTTVTSITTRVRDLLDRLEV